MFKKHLLLLVVSVCGSGNLEKTTVFIGVSRLWSRKGKKALGFICFWQPEPANTRANTRRAPGGARANSRGYNTLSKNPIKLKLS